MDRPHQVLGAGAGPQRPGGDGVEQLPLAQGGGGALRGRDRGQGDRPPVDAEAAEAGDEDEHLVQLGIALVGLEAGPQAAEPVAQLRPGQLRELGRRHPQQRRRDGGAGAGEEGGRQRPVERRLRGGADVEPVQAAALGQQRAIGRRLEVGELARQHRRRCVGADRQQRQPAAVGAAVGGQRAPAPLRLHRRQQLGALVAQQVGARRPRPGIFHRPRQQLRLVGARRQLRGQRPQVLGEAGVVEGQALAQLYVGDRRPAGHLARAARAARSRGR